MRIYKRRESVYFCDRLHLSCGIFVSQKMSWFLYILVFMLFHCIFFYFQFCSHFDKGMKEIFVEGSLLGHAGLR